MSKLKKQGMSHIEAFNHFMQNHYDRIFPKDTRKKSSPKWNDFNRVRAVARDIEKGREVKPNTIRHLLARVAPGCYMVDIVFFVEDMPG